jgi:acetylornithine/N-succinyldiaminopimelate aminotransferase
MTESQTLLSSARFRESKAQLLAAIAESSSRVRGIKGASSPEARDAYLKAIQEFQKDRGRDLYYPYLSAGLGAGPYLELADGSVKLDMISGIGINFFGHSHPELISEAIDAAVSDPMQGNLQPGIESRELIRAVVSRVGAGSRLAHGWLMCSGTMVNEVALKLIRQKKAPATRVLAFADGFHGRSTAMQELTDNPGYRAGQPLYGEVAYLPFYDPKLGLEASTQATLARMKEELTRYPGRYAALLMEPIQGEGGFNSAPREWYLKVFEAARVAGLAIWLDEIQTFGRTGELFAYQKLGIAEHVDVVTIGKLLQACMVLYTAEYNPKPGLVAGTFSGSAVALRTGRRVVELLEQGGFLGKDGRISKLSARFESKLGAIKGVSEVRAIGGMIAFVPRDGTMEQVKSVLMKLFDAGLVAFYCGHGPFLVRLLPPLGAMTEADVDLACGMIEKALA